jgi:hypothetical protein
MSFRHPGCIAGAICTLSVWGAVIALTWEKTVVAAIFGAAFLAGLVLFVVQAVKVRGELEETRKAIDLKLIEAGRRAEMVKKAPPGGVSMEGEKPGGMV